MATGSPLGHIALWNLEDRCLSATLRYAHGGCVSGMRFLQSQPLLISSGPDNSLKVSLSFFFNSYSSAYFLANLTFSSFYSNFISLFIYWLLFTWYI